MKTEKINIENRNRNIFLKENMETENIKQEIEKYK